MPNLDQVLASGNSSDLSAYIRNLVLAGVLTQSGDRILLGTIPGGDGSPVMAVEYVHHGTYPSIRLLPVGPNAESVRTVLNQLGGGVWIFDTSLPGEPMVTTDALGLHCAMNLTAHQSVAGGEYVESTEGFIRAATFLSTVGGQIRFMGSGESDPTIAYELNEGMYVFSPSVEGAPEKYGTANLRAGNVISAKGLVYYNANIAETGIPGFRSSGMLNVESVVFPNAESGDYSLIRVTFEHPITEPVVVFLPWENGHFNGEVLEDVVSTPVMVSLVTVTSEYFEVRLWQTQCVPALLEVTSYGFDRFNDIGGSFLVSGSLVV